jgi:hypothetical protein
MRPPQTSIQPPKIFNLHNLEPSVPRVWSFGNEPATRSSLESASNASRLGWPTLAVLQGWDASLYHIPLRDTEYARGNFAPPLVSNATRNARTSHPCECGAGP